MYPSFRKLKDNSHPSFCKTGLHRGFSKPNLNLNTPTLSLNSTISLNNSKSFNPLENYDVPKPQALYDTPRSIMGKPLSVMPTCTSVLGWAGDMMCGRRPHDHIMFDSPRSAERVPVNGEGKMPVVNANSVVLMHQPIQHLDVQGDVYAIVNKKKIHENTSKSKSCLSDQCAYRNSKNDLPTLPEHNYVNMNYMRNIKQTARRNLFCNDCHQLGCSKPDHIRTEIYSDHATRKVPNVEIPLTTHKQSSNNRDTNNEGHYIVMKAPTKNKNSSEYYICMKSMSFTNIKNSSQSNYKTSSLPRKFKAGESSNTRCSLINSKLSPLSSSVTLCNSSSNDVLQISKNAHTCEENQPKHPRAGRSMSFAVEEPLNFQSRPRSNSADSRMGETDVWMYNGVSSLSASNSLQTSPRQKRTYHRSQTHTDSTQLPGEGDSGCDVHDAVLKRSLSAPGNRDSSSSSDSGVCESFKSQHGQQVYQGLCDNSINQHGLMLIDNCFGQGDYYYYKIYSSILLMTNAHITIIILL